MVIKRIKQILLITLLAVTLAGAALIFITVRYQEQIVQLFITEANKRISTPVEVEKVHFSVLRNFPLITVSLDNVSISESYEESKGVLARAGTLSFSFNLFKALKQNIVVEGIRLADAQVLIRLDKDGVPNYRILSEGEGSQTPFFDLRNIRLANVDFKYLQESNGTSVELFTPEAEAMLSGNDKDIRIRASGTWIFKGITTGGKVWFEQKTVKASALANYNSVEKNVIIAESQIDIGGGSFVCTGFVDTDDKELKLNIDGENTNINTLLSLLPYQTSQLYRSYRSKGDVYFKSTIGGNYSLSRGIHVKAEFGATNAYFYHPKYKKGIEHVNFKGSFNNGAGNSPSTYQLKINDFSCVIDDQHLVGSIGYENFDDPWLRCAMKGEVNINSLLDIFPNQLVRSAYGKIEADIDCEGRLSDLKARHTRDKFKARGEIILKNVSFILHGERLPFNSFNGSFIFNKSDLAISEFTGHIGNSDFRVSGFFKSILSYLFSKKQEFNMVADLRSDHVDFDELLRSNFASRDTTDNSGDTYNFGIASNVNIDFNCDIRHLNFKRFHGRNMVGQLNINRRIAMFDNVSVNAMGGRILMEGSVGNRNSSLVEVLTEARLQGLNIDSIFYVFNNFNQNWLVDKNLKGRIHADVNTYMSFDNHLKLNKSSLIADINTRIDNGELIDFEPMQKLSKYVEEKSLAHLKFSELRNEIHISGQKIQLPEMTIRSNVTSMEVSGTHTFDQEIDYHIAVPLMSVFNVRKRKDFEENAVNGGNLLLKITGTTRDYKVSFDGSALGREITKDFRDERSEWKQMIENKGRTNDSIIELEEDEYFEFDKPDPEPERR